jgi:cytochrome c biogenesis protein
LTRNKSRVWSFFSSVGLTIALLAIIVLVSIIGTVVPQRESAAELAMRIPPGLFSFLQTMQLFDLYHSILFFLLLGLLSINLIICSINRFPQAWRHFRAKPSPENFDVFKDLSEDAIINTKQDQKVIAEIAATSMKSRFRGYQCQKTTDGLYLYGDKGRSSYFGVYVVHLSILILIVGVVIGSLFGIEGYVNIGEGETVNKIDLRDKEQTLPLPFAVRCDRFTIEFYENGAPKTYRSELTFLKNGQAASSGQLLVNHPLGFEGIRFYQSSYGLTSEGKVSLSLFKNGKKSQDISVGLGETFVLPGKEGKVNVLRVEENLMKMGPAIKLAVVSSQGETVFWVFRHIDKIKEVNPGIVQQIPMFNPGLFRPYVFVINGVQEKYYTGLQVNSDPGLPVVAAAAFLMFIGLMLVFFSSHRQVWLRVDVRGENTRISIAGRSHKDAVGLERDIKKILARIKTRLESSQ